MKIRSSKDRIISMAIAVSIISTCTIPNVIAESRNDINEPEQTISESDSQEEVYITGEIAELRSEYSKTYEQSDGGRISVVSAAPICLYDEEKEEWKEYDNRLNFNEETGSDMQVSLPKNIDEQNDIEVEGEGYKVSITPIDMNSSSSKKTNEKKNVKSSSEKNLKEYSLEDYVSDSVLDGKVEYTQDEASKVEYIFSGSGLKENIILSEAPINKQTYSFRIKADGLTAKLNIKTADNNGSKINAYKIKSDWSLKNVYKTAPEVSDTILDVCDVPDAKDKWVHWDITNAVNSWCNGEANYGIKLSAANVTNSESAFYSSEKADSEKIPFLAIKYNMVSAAQRGENKTVDISRAGKAEIDDFSGNLVLSREDIGYNGKVMPVNISMIYNLNNGSNPTFGFGFKTNYTQTIKSVYNSGKLQYYEYVCGDGSTIFFNYNNIADKYIDMSGSGYTIKCKDKNKTGCNRFGRKRASF